MAKTQTASEIIERLNREIPDSHRPKAGEVTRAAFSMKVKRGGIPFTMKKKTKYYSYREIAPIYGIEVKERKKTKKNIETIEATTEVDSSVLTSEIMKQFNETLEERLDGATTSKQEIEIEKLSYDSLNKQLETMKALGELIPIDDSKAVLEYTLGSVKAKIYELPPKLKTRFQHLKDEDITEISSMIDDIFTDLNENLK